MANTIAELAAALIAAHEGGPLVETVPDALVPGDVSGVYALQDAIVGQLGPVGGWKVAAGSGPEPLCSPLPQNRFFAAGDMLDGKRQRFVLAEVEVAVRLGADIAAGADTATVASAIESLHPALEMIASPFPNRDAMPKNLLQGDLLSNGAVVVGQALDDSARGALSTLAVSLEHDGRPVHSVEKGASWDDTLAAIAFLASHAAGRGLPLKAGQVIITGARALASLDGADLVEGQLGDFARIACRV